MYYVLDCDRLTDDEGGTLEVNDAIDAGVDLEQWSISLPLKLPTAGPFELKGRAVRGYQGPPADFYDFRVTLMSGPMVETLRRAGVDNLMTYPVTIVDEETGARWPFFAVNIIGRVAAADMVKSEWSSSHDPPQGDVEFETLVIDPARARGQLFFRLAENLTTILVHQRIKVALEKARLTGMSFVDPADWQT